MSNIYYNTSNMHIKHQPSVNKEQQAILNADQTEPQGNSDNTATMVDKNTEKDSVSLSVKARVSYEESLKTAEDNLPVPVKLLKAQLARLQQRMVDIKQEVDQINTNDRLDEETKSNMLVAKQDEIANVMSAIQTVNQALLDTMKPPS